jgi:hypothetical protein
MEGAAEAADTASAFFAGAYATLSAAFRVAAEDLNQAVSSLLIKGATRDADAASSGIDAEHLLDDFRRVQSEKARVASALSKADADLARVDDELRTADAAAEAIHEALGSDETATSSAIQTPRKALRDAHDAYVAARLAVVEEWRTGTLALRSALDLEFELLSKRERALKAVFAQGVRALAETANPISVSDMQQQRPQCTICLDQATGVALVPCGHLVCKQCSDHLVAACPMCRAPIENRVGLYW